MPDSQQPDSQAENARRRQLKLLADLARQLAGPDTPQALLDEAAKSLHQQFGFDLVCCLTTEADQLSVRSVQSRLATPFQPGDRIPLGQGLVGQAGLTGQKQLAEGEVAIPLRANDNTLGVLDVQSKQPDAFSLHTVHLLETVAASLAANLRARTLALELETHKRRAAQLSLLYDVSQHTAGSLDEAEVLQRIMTALVDRFGFTEAALLTPIEKDILEIVALATLEEMGMGLGFRQRFGEGVAGHAAAIRATHLSNDISSDPFYLNPRGRKKGSALAIPILQQGNLLAVLYLENSQPNAFSPDDVRAMEALSRHIATAMENARLYARANERLREMTALQSLSKAVTSSLELTEIIKTATQLLHLAFGYKYVVVALLENNVLRVGAQVGYQSPSDLLGIPVIDGINGRAVRTGQIQFIKDVRADPDYIQVASDAQSEICIPLLRNQLVLGVLDVSTPASRPLTETDVDLLTLFAGQVTIAIDNAQLYKNSQRHAEEQQLLFNATRDFTAGLSENEVLRAVASHLVNVIQVAECNILRWEWAANRVVSLLDYDGKEFVSNHAPGANEDLANYPATRQVLESRQPLVVRVDDPQGDPAERALMQQYDYTGLLMVPLFTGGQTFGVVELYRNASQPVFSDSEIQLAQSLAAQAAVAIFNARLMAETRRRAEEQGILFQAIRDFTSALDEDAVFDAIARHMTDALGMASCAISRWKRGDNQYSTVLYHDGTGRSGEGIVGSFLLDEYPATRRVLETGHSLVVRANDPNADAAERGFLEKHGYESVLLMPLLARDEVIGLLELYPQPGGPPFSESALQLANSLNAQAAIALENARLHAQEKKHAHELNVLLTANSALLVTLDLEPLLNNILAAAINTIPSAEKGSILLRDPATDRLQIRAVMGYSDPRIKTLVFAGDDGYSAKAARERRPIIIADARADSSTRYDGDIPEVLGIHSAIVAPLIFQESLVGVIALDSTRRSAFADADLKLLEAFASTAAATINHARAHAEAQNLADTDGYTGLANRRAFDRALVLELNRAERYSYQLSLIVLDIDSFKIYNDTYGHPAGDERLKTLADLLRANARDMDLAARYGGEEFAIILPHTDRNGALAVAERIRAAAEASAPEPHLLNGLIPGYTLSLGVATFPADGHTPGSLLLAADNAELVSKRSGKNRVSAARVLDLQP